MPFLCPLAAQAGRLKIAPLLALLTSCKELSCCSSREAQRWLDDEYRGESIQLSQQHLGVITVAEKWKDRIIIISHRGLSPSTPSSVFNEVRMWDPFSRCGKQRSVYFGRWQSEDEGRPWYHAFLTIISWSTFNWSAVDVLVMEPNKF